MQSLLVKERAGNHFKVASVKSAVWNLLAKETWSS